MSYQAEISRRNPTAILFLIDQSASMGRVCPDGLTPAHVLADAVNRLIGEAVLKCSKDDGVRDYFFVGVITYSGQEASDALSHVPGDDLLKPISLLADHPLRLEERTKLVVDGAGVSSSARSSSRSGSHQQPPARHRCATRFGSLTKRWDSGCSITPPPFRPR